MLLTSKQERDRNLAASEEPAGPTNKHTILSPSSRKHVRHNLLIFSLSISFVTINISPPFGKPQNVVLSRFSFLFPSAANRKLAQRKEYAGGVSPRSNQLLPYFLITTTRFSLLQHNLICSTSAHKFLIKQAWFIID